jgi:hypothetical protein
MGDAFKGVDSAQANVEPVRAGLAELVDGPGEPFGYLAFLDDGDLLTQTFIAALGLLASRFKLLPSVIVAALGLLAGVLKLLPTDADLPQGDCGAGKHEHGCQGLGQGSAGVVLELVTAFMAHSPVSRGQPGYGGVRQGGYRRWGEHRDAQPQRRDQQRGAGHAASAHPSRCRRTT